MLHADGSVQGQGPWDQTNKLSVEELKQGKSM